MIMLMLYNNNVALDNHWSLAPVHDKATMKEHVWTKNLFSRLLILGVFLDHLKLFKSNVKTGLPL